MPTQRYSVIPHPVETLLTWVKCGEIAIPENQRPFVWDATKVLTGLALSGVPYWLSDRLEESNRSPEGRNTVRWEKDTHRRSKTSHGAHGGAADVLRGALK
jgi:hypothetical protein